MKVAESIRLAKELVEALQGEASALRDALTTMPMRTTEYAKAQADVVAKERQAVAVYALVTTVERIRAAVE
jgi:GrpB-like predicted nucleotidyltransferase (UPF0157 family)